MYDMETGRRHVVVSTVNAYHFTSARREWHDPAVNLMMVSGFLQNKYDFNHRLASFGILNFSAGLYAMAWCVGQ